MTAAREAIVLPMLFLTVAGLGGLRVGHAILLVPPPLVSLVLAVMLIGALVRAGVFAPHGLMNAGRSALENLSGLAVIITLFAAAAQVFTLVTPERGLLHAVFSVSFFVQLATTLAGVNGRRNLLRSLVVLLGSAFVVRFVVLEGLYAPDGGIAKRLLTTIVEGASLGTIQYLPTGAATGYVAFFTLVLFVVGLVLLPPAPPRGRLRARPLRAFPTSLPTLAIMLAALLSGSCASKPAMPNPPDESGATASAARLREDLLAAARVWSKPPIPISRFDFVANPPGGFERTDQVSCRFTIQELNGATPKFHCQLPDGRILKVKYGRQNAELEAEVAGTRLLRALGFSADEMFNVRAVRCAGCPRFPFPSLICRERLGVDLLCFGGAIDYDRVRTFTSAVIERRLEGHAIEAFDGQGWSWYELDRIDPARGGSSRAEIDALRLMAVFLAHWDNKGPNQRLLCPQGRELSNGGCAAPVAMIQDLGATFGPRAVDLPNWRAAPIWKDRATCTVSMTALPYGGATFSDQRISEAGRLMIAELLEQLSTRQLEDLFTASGIVSYDAIDAEARAPAGWVRAFRDKVRTIRDGGPCPR
jgi:hypothetical protein